MFSVYVFKKFSIKIYKEFNNMHNAIIYAKKVKNKKYSVYVTGHGFELKKQHIENYKPEHNSETINYDGRLIKIKDIKQG